MLILSQEPSLCYKRMMKVLLTGGCGFIGSHVADAYLAKGYEVIIVDNLSTGKAENMPTGARLFRADIRTTHLEEIFQREIPDILNHHAAQISVPFSVQEPLVDAQINIEGTLRLLELAKRYGTRKVIFSSTGGAIYGEATEVPTGETYTPEPVSPYAISKFSAEKYIKFYHHQYGLNFVILRYSNVYGPRQIPHGEAGVVSIFTEKLLAGERPTLYHFDGEKRGMTRDYCYVKDIARANIVASEIEQTGIYNIGTGIGTCTLDLYRKILSAVRKTGKSLASVFDDPQKGLARPGDIRVSTLNIKKARTDLGWEPRYDLEAGLSETVNWYLQR